MSLLRKVLEALAFMGTMVALSVVYGIAHDLVTAHVAVEYFTIYHPKIIESDSPVAMALLWGVIATWWVGLGGGIILVVANLVGPEPMLAWKLIAKKAAMAMGALWVLAMAVLAVSYGLFGTTRSEPVRRLISVERTHLFSYGAASLAIILLATWIHLTRKRMETPE